MHTRRSRQRETILGIVKGTHAHPAAEWIHGEARKKIPHLSLGTTYRNLRLLAEEGMISELTEFGKPSRFDSITKPHSHFQCEECGKIINVNGKRDFSITREVAEEIGASILNQVMSFRGICHECQAPLVHAKQ